MDQVFQFVKEKNLASLAQLLKARGNTFDLNTRNDSGQTPLYWACELPTPEIAKLLVQFGADMNIAELTGGFTPLHLTAFIGNEPLAAYLIENGADIARRNNSGGTALHFAAKNNSVNIVTLLLKAGADPLAKDDKGNTPGDYAKSSNILKVLQTAIGSKPTAVAQTSAPPPTANTGSGSNQTLSGSQTLSSSQLTGSAADQEKLRQEKMAKLQRTISTASDIGVLRKIATVLQDTLTQEQGKTTNLQKSLTDEKAKLACVMCQSERNAVLIPCMHMSHCYKCACALSSCSICRLPVEGRLKCELKS